MRIHQEQFEIATRGRGPVEISGSIRGLLQPLQMSTGLCHLFCRHTSASLTITENADPTVLHDLEGYLERSIPDGDPRYAHSMEGPDDMSAHIRSVLTGSGLTIPFSRGELCLGTWQGVFLWEHRTRRHSRTVVVTFLGT
ncbi:secondary thiamine-phosphate synthase [Halorhodospira abdelmalekii]|uniref:secondary thiamine-phosphate synthase enzyme YjbQ n=1 Tax=Halorhodospira abdelmalekii TaxID=421629 RepID=UPI001906DC70|nr:secondary thiamine-phosphate synthase [Halorhodospira abdelmalekii]